MASDTGSLAGFESLEKLLEVRVGHVHLFTTTGARGRFMSVACVYCNVSHACVHHVPRLAAPPARMARHVRARPLQEHVPADKMHEVRRVLYGSNAGGAVASLELPKAAVDAAHAADFDCQGYSFKAAPEELRAPRVVRVGLVQNAIVMPTTAPFAEQKKVRVGGRRGRRPWLLSPRRAGPRCAAAHFFVASPPFRLVPGLVVAPPPPHPLSHTRTHVQCRPSTSASRKSRRPPDRLE